MARKVLLVPSAIIAGALFHVTTSRAQAAPERSWSFDPSQSSPPSSDDDRPRPRVTHFTDRPLALELTTGFGTPVGLLGVVAEYSFDDAAAVGAGVGTGPVGVEGAAMLNLRPAHWETPRAAHAISTTFAYSAGRWVDYRFDPTFGSLAERSPDPLEQHFASDFAHWLQLDLGYELRTHGGIAFRVANGAALMLNPGHAGCRLKDETPVPCEGAELQGATPPTSKPIYTLTVSIGPALGG